MQHRSGDRSAGGSCRRHTTATSSSSHVYVGGASGRHLPPDCRHKAGAPLTAAPAAVTARGGLHLCRRLCNPPSRLGGHQRRCCVRDNDIGHLPPPRSEGLAGGMLPSRPGPTSSSATVLAAARCQYVHASVLVCNVVVGERVNTLSRDLCVVYLSSCVTLPSCLCNFSKVEQV